MRVDALTPVLRAAPGERAMCRLRIENDDAGPLSYGLRVVGFDENHVLRPAPNGPLAAGSAEEVELEFQIPAAFAAGHHSIAVEVTPARPGSPPVIAGITVSVGQIDDVAMAVVPSTVRGRRRGKFRLDLDNRSRDTIDVELGGEGPDLRVTLRPDRVELRPGDRVRTSGKVKGPRHLVGDPRQHSFTVTARSKSAPSYAPGTFHQRPLLPRSLRTLVAALLLVGIWAGALGAGVYWWMERDEGGPTANLVQLVDTDGDGVADTPADQLVDTDGDGVPDTPASVVAAEVAAGGGGEPQAGGSGLPTRTVVGGTVKAGDTGDDADVRVTLTPIDLAPTPADALPTPAGESRGISRLPQQASPPEQPGVSAARQTVSVESAVTGPDGAWLFADVPIRQTYELNFALEGFDSQSFVVTPPDDGSPVEMEVVLEPASGALSGSVVGPGGPLGNVDLVLTDGELTFNTTTASAGDVGTWSLSGVSTPGTYTLTATLRGYGTEVVQITLDPGEQRSGVTISMVPDVGSIIGRVSADGVALGGVTLTASSGDETRTTTSLTEGDTGLYSFPRLGTPGRYTVTASRDGYVTQTRLVTLGGNVTGVDFNLVRTTATIRGVVTSVGRRGHERGPLPGAAITVSRDELSFDTESASPPAENVGSFVITDLPPGTYLVGFARFDHRPASQLVTVAAGEVVDLGKVPLRFAPRRGVDQLGSLEVRVVDEGGDPLLGSTVTVRDVATGEIVASMSDEGADRQSTFVFDPLDVGTYEVTGTKPQFKPRTARVSIGPERRESIQLILFEQGQARGQIVDSLTGAPLTGYFVTIHTVLSNGDVGPPFLPPIAPGPPDDEGRIFWETPPRSLPIGRYAVLVTQPPPGYRVRPDQVLAPELPPMQFDVLPEGQDVLVLEDIEADPLPNVTGRIIDPDNSAINSTSLEVGLTCPTGTARFEGRRDGDSEPGFDSFSFPKETVSQALGSANSATCTISFELAGFVDTTREVLLQPSDGRRDPDIELNVVLFPLPTVSGRVLAPRLGAPNAVSFVAINSLSLEVGLTCPGQDEVLGQRNDDGLPGDERYLFPPETIEQLLGVAASATCTLRFDAGGYVGTTVSVQLLASDTTRNPDVTRNVALLKPSDVGGTAYWIDRGNGDARMSAGGIDVRSTDRVITGFAPSAGNADPAFVVSDTRVSTVTESAPPGTIGESPWVFGNPRQRFGRMTYDFSDPAGNYANRQIAITIDEDGRSVAPVQPPTGLELDNSIAVELDADGGLIDANVTLHSSTPDFTGFAMQLTGAATSTTPVEHVGPDASDGRARVTTADPGTYQAAMTIPDHHRSFDGKDQSGIILFQAPGQDLDDPRLDLEYVELGQIDVQVLDGLGNPIPTATIDVRHDNNGAPDDPPTEVVADDATVNAEGRATFLDLEVNGVNPETTPVAYVVSASADDHDLTEATATVEVVAGGAPSITITLPHYGSITGAVVGRVPGQSDVPIPVGGRLTIVAQRRFRLDGTPVAPPEAPLPVEAVGNGFAISGPPGYYTIEVSHPDFDPLSAPADTTIGGLAVFRMTNLDSRDGFPDVPHEVGTWVLAAKPGRLDLTVHEDTLSNPAGVGGASVTLDGPTDFTGVTDASGHILVENLPQGDYVLTIRERDPLTQDDLSFPVIVTVNIPFGASDAARTRVVHAPLPRIGGELVGDIEAVNSENDPVPVPEVTVSREYTPPKVQVGPGPSVPGTTVLVDNTATEGDLVRESAPGPVPTVTVGPDAEGDPVRYEFENLATGIHPLTFSGATGYIAPGEVIGVVDSILPVPPGQTNVDPVEYEAEDRTVIVTVTTGCEQPDDATTPCLAVNDATVTLTQTDPADGDVDTQMTGTGGAYTFTDVPPELTDYDVTVDKDLFVRQRETVLIPPGDPTVAIEIDVDLPPAFARIIGLAQKRQSSQTISDFANEGTASLINVSADPDVVVATATPGGECDNNPATPHCNYLFEVAAAELAGEYKVRLELNGYATRESAVFSAPVGATTTVPTLVVPALATMTITVNGLQPNDPMSVAITAPSSQIGVTPSRSGRNFTFRLDPGTNPGNGFAYSFQASSPGFISATVEGGPFTFAPGQTLTRSVSLTEREVSGTVTGATNNTRVELRDEDENVVDFTATNGSGDYTFEGVDAGTWKIVSASFGVGRGETTRTITPTSPSITDADFNLVARNVTVSYTVNPTDATVVLRSGNTTVDSVPPLVGTERQLPFTLRASRTGFVTQDVAVPSPSPDGSFDALSFTVNAGAITLAPVPTTTTTTTTTTTSTTSTTSTTVN